MFERGTQRRWRLREPFTWYVGRAKNAYPVVIPSGFEFESSVPRWALWIQSPDDPRYLKAALVHDYLLETRIYGRAQAAAEWFDGALAGGAPVYRSKIIYVGMAFWAVFKPGAV